MNLIHSHWIPVRCQSGAHRLISPLQLIFTDDPPLELAALRPDFNGALAQFLIGMLQLIAPPSAKDINASIIDAAHFELDQLQGYAQYFEFAQGPARVMQDMDFDLAEALDLTVLLIEAPGENTVKNNADLFIKRSEPPKLTLALAAQALITLQMNAPSGGAGHRTSLRGGGPISMMLWPPTLFEKPSTLLQKLLLNVLPSESDLPRINIALPWTTACLTSEGGKDVLSELAKRDPTELERMLLCYFATPRRIRLQFQAEGVCDLTGESAAMATGYETKNFGANYLSDRFRHPLSPYYQSKTGLLPMHLNALGFTYGDWIHTVEITNNADAKAPKVLDTSRLSLALQRSLGRTAIWAFGFQMDNMKCLAWHEARFPVLAVNAAKQSMVLTHAKQLVGAVEATRKALVKSLRNAWNYEGKDRVAIAAERELYARTESAFYTSLNCLAQCADEEAVQIQLATDERRSWFQTLRSTAFALFESYAETSDVREQTMQAIERAAKAHKALGLSLRIDVKALLALESSAEKASKKSSKSNQPRKAA